MATVSRVVNGNMNVKENTRVKVLAAVKELDYRPNAIARGLASKKSTTIGVVMPSFMHSIYSRIVIGIDDVARMYNYTILVANSEDDEKKEISVINELIAKQVDGIILMGNRISEALRSQISRMRTPIVLAGMIDHEGQVPTVTIDHEKATFEAVGLLASRNEKVAMVSGPLTTGINSMRFSGYKQALKKFKREFSEARVIETDYSYKKGYALVERIKATGATAVYVTDDEVAAGLLNGLLDSGVRVPEEVEIMASNNTIVTNFTRPNMSSIDQPLYDVGAVSMRFLTKIINKEEVEDKVAILPYRIEIKKSTRQ